MALPVCSWCRLPCPVTFLAASVHGGPVVAVLCRFGGMILPVDYLIESRHVARF